MNKISDSVGTQNDVATCEQCGSASRIGRGLCLNCLLHRCLDAKSGNAQTLYEALDEVDVRDAEWRIGNYQILEEIGRGGMGVIYRARQRHSRRIVALKRILSYQADSHETLVRFRREAEAAASLDHPNILPIYEVGECEEGLPFFSMKFAAGGSLLDVAAVLRNEARRRVALLAKVARAVHHAHTRGILHRDLKPGNILLDGCGEPMVSDFGLAKWLDTSTDLTRTLTIFGTPGYIAPEQAKRSAGKLTPAADVYSLGAILFDLFTGRPPFLGEHALAVIEQAAEKPAPKLRTLTPTADRDLETICAKCLERQPVTRYQSAADLAQDLEYWLEGKPIRARRSLPTTRIWRWSRRNPVLVGTAAACLLLGAASIWLLQPTKVRQTSNITKKPALSPQQSAAQAKLRQALLQYPDADVEVQYSHLGYTNSGQASMQERLYSTVAARVTCDPKFLRDKLPKFAEAVKSDPDVRVYERACAAYLGKDYTEAERLALQAAVDAQKTPARRTNDEVDQLNLAAWSARSSSEFTRAMDHLREAEKLTDQQQDPKRWADIQFSIGNVFLGLQEPDEAEKRFRDVIDVRTRVLGPEDRQTLRVRRRRAFALLDLAKYSEAVAEYRELIRLDEKNLGPEHPETLWSRWDLTMALSGNYGGGDTQACLAELLPLLKLREKVLGPEHPDTLRTRGAVANMLNSSGQYAEAIRQLRELAAIQQKVLGPDDNGTLLTLVNLGEDVANTGDFTQAEAILREALQRRQKTLGPAHHSTLYCHEDLIKTLALEGRYAEAEDQTREVIRLGDTSVGVERAASSHDLLGWILDKEGKHQEAEAEIRQALRMFENTRGAENSDTVSTRGSLARNLWFQDKNAEAEAQLRKVVAISEKTLGAKAYTRANNFSSRLSQDVTPLLARILLANVLRDQQRLAEAEAQYKEMIALYENSLGPEDRGTLNAYYHYAYHLAQQGKRNEAKALAERAAKGAVKVLGADDPNTREYEKFLEILESDRPITVPYMKFHETFAFAASGGEQALR